VPVSIKCYRRISRNWSVSSCSFCRHTVLYDAIIVDTVSVALLWTSEFMSIQWCQSDQVGVS